MARARKLHAVSDNLIVLANLRNQRTKALVSGATVSARVLFIVDQSGGSSPGDPVTGVADPLSMPAEAGKTGVYVGTIPDTADLEPGDEVQVVITADGGAGLLRTFYLDAVVEETPD